jgi:hypothetical protein
MRLKREIGWLDRVERAKKPSHLLVVPFALCDRTQISKAAHRVFPLILVLARDNGTIWAKEFCRAR